MSLYKLSRVAMYGGLFIGVTTLGTYAYASKGITMSPVYVEAARCASENAQLMHAMGDKVLVQDGVRMMHVVCKHQRPNARG
eukprot:m.5932 g.5932  ORF g.5932 m.5932 type:complete len:82 (+) comp5107_c0_seq1:201-446(+)